MPTYKLTHKIHKKHMEPVGMHDLQLFAYKDVQTDIDSAKGAFKHVPLPSEPINEHHRRAKLTIVQSLYLKRPLLAPTDPNQ